MLAICLLIISCFPMIPASALDSNPLLRIGIFYGNNALPSANLANEVGSGYSLGYFDSQKQFFPLYAIGAEKISVLKDKPIYINSSNLYTDVLPSSCVGTIGPYHLQTQSSFPDAASARAFADTVSAGLKVPAFPAFHNGTFVVRIGSYLTTGSASAQSAGFSSVAGSLTVAGGSATCYTVTITGTTTILFEFDSNQSSFGIMPASQGGSAVTWFKGFKYYGGFDYNRMSGNDITVSNVVSMQDYLKGVVPYEMAPSWPLEALKAQAVGARSYAVTCLGKHGAQGFDLCNTDHCQVYSGLNIANAATNKAVDDTFATYATYNGSPIQAFYHSSSGGSTEDPLYIWGGSIPYLKPVSTEAFENISAVPGGLWSFELTPQMITAILKEKNYSVGGSGIVDMYAEYTPAGNVQKLHFIDSQGGVITVDKERCRTLINSAAYNVKTYSHRFTLDAKLSLYINGVANETPAVTGIPSSLTKTHAIGAGGQVRTLQPGYTKVSILTKTGREGVSSSSVRFFIDGGGWGHNIGMSQYGARGMALQGYTYDQILKYFYTGIQVTRLA